jgi:hypothetical protein
MSSRGMGLFIPLEAPYSLSGKSTGKYKLISHHN